MHKVVGIFFALSTACAQTIFTSDSKHSSLKRKRECGKAVVNSVSFDDHIITASSDKTVRVWDPTTGSCLEILSKRNHFHTIDQYGSIAAVGDRTNIHLWKPLSLGKNVR